MEFTLSQLITAFLFSLVLGFCLGVIYEPIRILHKIGLNGKIHYFIFDCSFMVICGLVTFFYSLSMLEGRIRAFVILGEIIGFLLFHHSITPVTDKIYDPILKFFRKILKYLLKISRKVMYNIKNKLVYILKFLKDKLKKFSNKVTIYGRRKENRKNRNKKEKRNKRSNSPKKEKK
ncbi:MAG: spore cortex biosynthesis protein YabQ [Ruminococcus sp.]|nr:spore cortex biosynthesis protein YabQ [Ruminococcus sp.]